MIIVFSFSVQEVSQLASTFCAGHDFHGFREFFCEVQTKRTITLSLECLYSRLTHVIRPTSQSCLDP